MVFIGHLAYAEAVPQWVKNNAKWWVEGSISKDEFVQGLKVLIQEEILIVPPTNVSSEKSEDFPEWFKQTTTWWVDGEVSDEEFISAVQSMIKTGVITIDVATESTSQANNESTQVEPEPQVEMETTAPVETVSQDDSGLTALQAELEGCQEIKKAYERLDCEKAVKTKITLHDYKNSGQAYEVGPITFYWKGSGSEGNDFEIAETGQAILNVRMLAETTGSNDNVSLSCTGPAICAYDVWNGEKAFKYSGMDFTNRQIVIKPGDSREI